MLYEAPNAPAWADGLPRQAIGCAGRRSGRVNVPLLLLLSQSVIQCPHVDPEPRGELAGVLDERQPGGPA
jgi:hypothetical protein